MSDEAPKSPSGSIESLSSQLEAVAVSTLLGAMIGNDRVLAVNAAGMVLKALGKDSKPKETAQPQNVLNINMLGPLKESMKGLASMATLIGGKDNATDA